MYRTEIEESTDRFISKAKTTNRMLLIAIALVVLVPLLYNIYLDSKINFVKQVDIKDLTVLSGTDLCIGDTLTFAYTLHARGSGVLALDLTLWRVDPPKTVIYSKSERFIIDEPVEQRSVESWRVSSFYKNREKDMLDFIPPGNYRRIIAISSPTNYKIVDIESIDFTIKSKEECA